MTLADSIAETARAVVTLLVKERAIGDARIIVAEDAKARTNGFN